MRSVIALASAVVPLMFAGDIIPGERSSGGAQKGTMVEIESGGRTYPAYIAAPGGNGTHPAVVMIHSFKGLEPGYREIADRLAGEGFVVIAPAWQTHAQAPEDTVTEGLIRDTIAYLETRPDADTGSLGLTGFCAGGRYTMLFLPLIEEFGSAVAWYGFPYSGGQANGTPPADHIGEIADPMLMIHGTADRASPVVDIFRYATDLDAAGKYFELKVYQGEPHGFMVPNGHISQSFVGKDAYREMVAFFRRTLG